jgi:hypothetical protein
MDIPPTDPAEALIGPADLVLRDGHLIIRDPDLVQRLSRLAAELDTTPDVLVARWLNRLLGDA